MFKEHEFLNKKKSKIRGRNLELDSISLERIIGEDDLIKMIVNPEIEKDKISLWFKIKKFFLKILSLIINFFKKIFNKFRRKKLKKDKKKETYAFFSSPSFGNVFHDVDYQIKNALQSKEFSSYIDNKMKSKKMRIFNEDTYLDEAKNIVKKHLEEKIRKEKRKIDDKKVSSKKEIELIKNEEENLKIKEKEEQDKLKKLYEIEKENIEKQTIEKPDEFLKDRIMDSLKQSNYLYERDGKLEITSNLIERFADIILSQEIQALPSNYQARFGTSVNREGIYEKDKMLSIYEISRMDIAESLIQSRISHPKDKHIYDDDIFVKRELSGLNLHVVIMFDKSYSMEENNRILAAKRAVMALYKAVKKQNSRNIIDLIGFDTNINIMGLIDVWSAEPKGFTNIAGALRIANTLFYESKADNYFAYLITDGLPEAYTDADGNDVIGEPEISLKHAMNEAKKINGKLTMILLEPKEDLYVESAKKIVNSSLKGKLVITDPNELAKEMLGDYIRDTL